MPVKIENFEVVDRSEPNTQVLASEFTDTSATPAQQNQRLNIRKTLKRMAQRANRLSAD